MYAEKLVGNAAFRWVFSDDESAEPAYPLNLHHSPMEALNICSGFTAWVYHHTDDELLVKVDMTDTVTTLNTAVSLLVEEVDVPDEVFKLLMHKQLPPNIDENSSLCLQRLHMAAKTEAGDMKLIRSIAAFGSYTETVDYMILKALEAAEPELVRDTANSINLTEGDDMDNDLLNDKELLLGQYLKAKTEFRKAMRLRVQAYREMKDPVGEAQDLGMHAEIMYESFTSAAKAQRIKLVKLMKDVNILKMFNQA